MNFRRLFLQEIFPEMSGRLFDTSDWTLKQGVTMTEYYNTIMSFAICFTIHFDDFDLIESEESFTNDIVLPAYFEIEKRFGVKPIIVKISNVGEHQSDPFWWCYAKESRIVVDQHIKSFK